MKASRAARWGALLLALVGVGAWAFVHRDELRARVGLPVGARDPKLLAYLPGGPGYFWIADLDPARWPHSKSSRESLPQLAGHAFAGADGDRLVELLEVVAGADDVAVARL